MQIIILFLVLVISFVLGLLVYQNNPKSASNRLFTVLSLIISAWSIVIFLSTNQTAFIIFEPITLTRVSLFFAVLLVAVFLVFSVTFPKNTLALKKRELFGILFVFGFLSVFVLTPYVFEDIKLIEDTLIPQVGRGIPAFAITVNLTALLSLVLLVKRFLTAKGTEQVQLGYVLLGTGLMLGLIFSTIFLPAVFFGNSSFVFLGPVYSLIFLSSASYAIIRLRMLELRFIVARSVAYLLVIFFLAIVYSILIISISIFITGQRVVLTNVITSIGFTLGAVLTFHPLIRVLEKITDTIFYKNHYDANELLWNLSRAMASSLNLSKLSNDILSILLKNMKIRYGAFVLIRNSSIVWVGSSGAVAHKKFRGKDVILLIEKSNNMHMHHEHILVFEELEESETKHIMREHDFTVVLPLTVRKELIGGILLGEKSSGEIYSSEDINLLKILAPEIAVAINNALSFEEIRKFNVTLEEEVKRATTRLRKANVRLKELDVLKDEFVSIASHELRTPMTAIKSYLWMALNKSKHLDKTTKKYLSISYHSTERLISLVNDMLTVSRIERNKIILKKEKVNIPDILEQVHEELGITAKEKGITFTYTYGSKKLFVKGDKIKLREVFQNIIGNALKFTPENGSITVQALKTDSHVCVSVTDTGSGIPEDQLDKLFKKFSKIEYSYSKHSSQPGTGLGLYISKQIVSLHDGKITVESEVGKGTTFLVSLPLLAS